jgi:WD40 repeat protein
MCFLLGCLEEATKQMGSGAGADESNYDLFLSYNSADHRIVEEVAHELADAGLKDLFLDRWNLPIGTRWRPMLEKALGSSKAVAIFVGSGEMGSWQQREVDIALDLQSKSANFPVIPVLLPGCEPPLGFLGQLTWVDFRSKALEVGVAILAKAARGEELGPDLQRHLDSVRASVCPYRGLLYFREEDTPFFFGREVLIERLVDEVRRQPLVAIVGASGSGKSSVVRAGLLPKLRKARETVWESVILVPTDQPLKALARAFLPLLEPSMGEVDRLVEATKLAEHFRSGTISLHDIIERILEKQSGTDRVLIVVDQFEELYTLTSDEEARRRFVDELLAASSRDGSKANIALTLRGDFVGKALAYRPLSDRLQDVQINLGPMTREELECAIRKPAEKIQLEFEAGLVRRILDDVGDEPGNLPLLEFVLKELWDKRRGRLLLNETYDAIGGLQGAVPTKADELFKRLSSAEQRNLQRVFLRIVRLSKSGADTRRRASFAELPPEGPELVVRLAQERLLVTNQSEGGLEPTVEIAHEALISNWGTLRAWVNEDREFLLWRTRLDAWLQEWERVEESGDALLRGPLLVEAQKWFNQRGEDLSVQERKYISESRTLRDRLAQEERDRQERELEIARELAQEQKQRAEMFEQREREQKETARRLRRRAIAAAGAAAAAVVLSTIAVFLWRGAQEQAKIATVRRLAAESAAVSANHPIQGLLLAVEAVKNEESLHSLGPGVAEQSLREAIGILGGRIVAQSEKAINDLSISSDNHWLVTVAGNSHYDGTALLWDLRSKNLAASPIELGGHKWGVTAMGISPDSHWLVTGGQEAAAQLWDLRLKDPSKNPVELHHEYGDRDLECRGLAFSQDSHWLVTCGRAGVAVLWDLSAKDPSANALEFSTGMFGGSINAVAISPDDHWMVCNDGSSVLLWDLTAKEPSTNWVELPGHEGKINAIAISPNGHWLVTGSDDKTARLWDLTARNPSMVVLRGHEDAVTSVAISPDNNRLATCGFDETTRLWDLSAKDPLANSVVLRGQQGVVRAVAFSRDSHWLVTGSGHIALLWDVSAKDPSVRPIEFSEDLESGGAVVLARIGIDNNWLVTASTDNIVSSTDYIVRLRDLNSINTSANRVVLRGVKAVAMSADNHWLVTCGSHWIRVWDLAARVPTTSTVVLSGLGEYVGAVRISADKHWLITDAGDGTQLWDLDAKDPATDPVSLQGVRFLAISGHRLLTRNSTKIQLWDLSAKDPLANPKVLDADKEQVKSWTISADSQWMVTFSEDKIARLWNLTDENVSGEPEVLCQHADFVTAFGICPDNQWLVTGSVDGTVRLWRLQLKDLIESARAIAGRNFTHEEWHQYFQDAPYLRTFVDLPVP